MSQEANNQKVSQQTPPAEKPKFKFPTEFVDLPSGGIVYAKDNPLSSGKVEMKYMTAKEEDIITNQAYIQKGIIIDKLLEALVVSRGVDVNDLIDDGSFTEIVKEEYALIFVQRLSKLQESANKLKKLGYYDKYYNIYNVEDIYEQREKYYNQLKRSIKWQ